MSWQRVRTYSCVICQNPAFKVEHLELATKSPIYLENNVEHRFVTFHLKITLKLNFKDVPGVPLQNPFSGARACSAFLKARKRGAVVRNQAG